MNKRKLRLSRLLIIFGVFFTFSFFVARGVGMIFGEKTLTCEEIPDVGYEKSHDLNTLLDLSYTTPPKEENEESVLVPNYDTVESLSETPASKNAILVSTDSGRVITEKNSRERIYPASMTKIMTLIVAAEHYDSLHSTFTMSYKITDPLYQQGATVMGLLSGETVPKIDLMYGVVLPSGADATIALAHMVVGRTDNADSMSNEDAEALFAELMNKKAEELGLVDTHFTNTSGLHDEDHYTTAHDMAVILDYAMKDELCRKILTTRTYTTTPTKQHPEGITMRSTMFDKVKANEVDRVEILGGKTGYTYQAGHCLASIARKGEATYIVVTAGGENRLSPVEDLHLFYGEYA